MEQEEIARRNIAIAAYMGWQVTNDVIHGTNIGWDKGYSMIEATWMAVSEHVLSLK